MSAEITRINTAAETKLIEQFKAVHGNGSADDRRGEAIESFARTGLPHRRLEAWHYTDLRTTMRDAYAPTSTPDTATIAKARALLERQPTKGERVVLLDGFFSPELSSRTGVEGLAVRSLLDVLGEGPSAEIDLLAARAIEESDALISLNAAFMQGGAVVTIAPGAKLNRPIEVVFISSGASASAVTTRSLVWAGADSSAIVVERHQGLGDAPSQGNHVMIVEVGDGAALDHVAMASSGERGPLQEVATLVANLGAGSRLTSFALVTGASVVRRQSFVDFNGAYAKGDLRGISLLDGAGHADSTLVVTHRATHCVSREMFKHILDGEATGVFQGKVIVAPGAQKTDGKMMSRAIFLADGCTMYNKPELEIFADDVVCGHGATAGFLDEDQLFYLRARGIPEKEAQALLLEAFAAEAIEDIGTEEIRAELTESVAYGCDDDRDDRRFRRREGPGRLPRAHLG